MAETHNKHTHTKRVKDSVEISTPFIGRDNELQLLLDRLYTMLEQGGTHCVAVVGESGIGKSRLVHEFCSRAEQDPSDIEHVHAPPNLSQQTQFYSVWHTLFATMFDIADYDSADSMRTKFEQGVARTLGSESLEKAAFIGQLFGFDFTSSPFLRGIRHDARQIHTRALHYVSQFFQAFTTQHPLIITFEDMHEADDPSLDVLEYLVSECHDARLLLVVIGLQELLEKRKPWMSHSHRLYTYLTVPPLSEPDSYTFIQNLLSDVREIPDTLYTLITQHAEGNPFHIEELINVFMNDGVIEQQGQERRVHLSQLHNISIQPILTDVLQRRLTNLTLDEQTVLAQASVVGRIFWRGAINYLQQHSPAVYQHSDTSIDLNAVLVALQQRDLIVEQPLSTLINEKEYRFKHVFLQKMIYESISSERCQYYHAQVAAWLMSWGNDRVSEHAGIVATHFEKAGNVVQAAEWYTHAGHYAQERNVPVVAIDHFERALSLLPGIPTHALQRIELYEHLGKLKTSRIVHKEALALFAAMFTLAEEIHNTRMQARALNGMATVYDYQGNAQRCLECSRQAEQLVRPLDLSEELLVALSRIGWTLVRQGHRDEGLQIVEEVLQISRCIGNKYHEATTLSLVGITYEQLGQYQMAEQAVRDALAIHRANRDHRSEAIALNNLAHITNDSGRYQQGLHYAKEAIHITREIGEQLLSIHFSSTLTQSQNGLGAYADAEATMQESMRQAESYGKVTFTHLYYFLSEAQLGQGKIEEALSTAQQALHYAQQNPIARDLGIAWRVVGQAMAQMPDHIGATACFKESLHILTEASLTGDRVRTLRSWAEYELQRGDYEQGLVYWREAREIFREIGVDTAVREMEIVPDRQPDADERAAGAD